MGDQSPANALVQAILALAKVDGKDASAAVKQAELAMLGMKRKWRKMADDLDQSRKLTATAREVVDQVHRFLRRTVEVWPSWSLEFATDLSPALLCFGICFSIDTSISATMRVGDYFAGAPASRQLLVRAAPLRKRNPLMSGFSAQPYRGTDRACFSGGILGRSS